eukprot:751472-Hanusia_phi.AAC.1
MFALPPPPPPPPASLPCYTHNFAQLYILSTDRGEGGRNVEEFDGGQGSDCETGGGRKRTGGRERREGGRERRDKAGDCFFLFLTSLAREASAQARVFIVVSIISLLLLLFFIKLALELDNFARQQRDRKSDYQQDETGGLFLLLLLPLYSNTFTVSDLTLPVQDPKVLGEERQGEERRRRPPPLCSHSAAGACDRVQHPQRIQVGEEAEDEGEVELAGAAGRDAAAGGD